MQNVVAESLNLASSGVKTNIGVSVSKGAVCISALMLRECGWSG